VPAGQTDILLAATDGQHVWSKPMQYDDFLKYVC